MNKLSVFAFTTSLSVCNTVIADDSFTNLPFKQQQLANKLVNISMNTFNICRVFDSYAKESISNIKDPKQKCVFTTLASYDNFYDFQKAKAITYVKNNSLETLDKQLNIFSPTLNDYLKRSFETGFKHGLSNSNDLTSAKKLNDELKNNPMLATNFKTLTYSSDYSQIRNYLNYEVNSTDNIPFKDYMIWSYGKCNDSEQKNQFKKVR